MTDHDIIPPTVILTGPTRGIGAAMLDHLIAHPASPRLVLLARDPHALDAAVRRARGAGREAIGIPIDLADLGSVDAAIEELRVRIADGAIAAPSAAMLNAGAQFADRRGTSANGIEQTFAVNVVAQHVLVRGLLPILARRAHLVLMGSSTHRGRAQSFGLIPSPRYAPPETLASVDRTDSGATRHAGGRAYADSKLALVTLAHAWARRAAASGRRLNTYDPGLVPGTGLGRTLPGYMHWTWEHVMPAMAVLPRAATPRTSARHAIDLLLGDRHPTLHGGYVELGRPTLAAEPTFDLDHQEELFGWIEERHPERVAQRAAQLP
ncbi:SDR family NAD(P)-dependent oxidoreductase [Agromyces tardus]|uniref:SDR family NAD(P)-dependent oxidoreductase n=1 Tax=Agromyces tardus TaxID=2583849 RepID=A0A3M8AFY6_9MICO|nr:SDR family NAD(P)-dependent oxidoreductase [Agromyces tardus]RNB50102.1 SDR family NAD(P)-dependent oxidoreductase [Agromyces tardus]